MFVFSIPISAPSSTDRRRRSFLPGSDSALCCRAGGIARLWCLLPALLLLVAIAFLFSETSRAEVRMDAVRVTIDLSLKNRIAVTERFESFCDAPRTNHGMYRSIPVRRSISKPGTPEPEFRLLWTAMDGRRLPPGDEERRDGNAVVYIRDRKAWLDSGPHVFELSYEMTGLIDFFKGMDELAWTVSSMPISKSSCLIRAPEGVSFIGWNVWFGERGSKNESADVVRSASGGRDAILFTSRRPLGRWDAFTVYVAMPPGTVSRPSPADPAKR